MHLIIDGTDFSNYVAQGGLKWQRNDVEGPSAGRTVDGTMHRERVGVKVTLDVTCRMLTKREAARILQAILPEFVTVEYDDPMYGATIVSTMYSNNVPATHQFTKNGVDYFAGITFPLIEQ